MVTGSYIDILIHICNVNNFICHFYHRGHNQPCIDTRTNRCHLTMQNHGYAIDISTLPSNWKPFFYNANDGTNEGNFNNIV